jgi:hypothetical protein
MPQKPTPIFITIRGPQAHRDSGGAGDGMLNLKPFRPCSENVRFLNSSVQKA